MTHRDTPDGTRPPPPLPPETALALARTWERVLADKYPGTVWTIDYDPDPTRVAERLRDDDP